MYGDIGSNSFFSHRVRSAIDLDPKSTVMFFIGSFKLLKQLHRLAAH